MTPWYERYFTADYWTYADDEYDPARTAAEVDYLAGVLRAHAPGRRVVDLGCGVGRHAVALAALGFAVTGLDVSPYALERAARAASTAGVRLDLRQVDLLSASPWGVDGSFDAVICVQAFGWGSDADQLRLLRRARRVLAPGGVLLLDHSNVLAITGGYRPEDRVTVAGTDFHFIRRYDALTGRSSGEVRIRRPDGSAVTLPDDVRLYPPAEVATLLRRAGFEVVSADSGFTAGAPVTMASRYVQFTARPAAPVASALTGHRAPVDGLDLKWAPDEAEFVTGALASAWSAVSGVDQARRYDLTDPYGAARVGAALAASLRWDAPPDLADRVSVGAGVTGLLHDLARLADGGAVLLDEAGHPHLAAAAEAAGDEVRVAALSSLDAALAAIARHRPAVTVVDRPAVRGRALSGADVRALAAAAVSVGGVLIVDETCGGYLSPDDSVAPLTDDVPGLVVLRGMSKGWCCGGLRVGFAVAAPDVAAPVRSVLAPLAGGALALDVAVALLGQADPLARLRARIAAVKPRVTAALAGLGIAALETDPAVPWLALPASAAPVLAAHRLVAKDVPVRSGPDRPAAPLLRLSVPLSDARLDAFNEATAALRTAR